MRARAQAPPLFHAAGKFVNVRVFEFGQSHRIPDQDRDDIATIPRGFQVRLQPQSENDVAENIEPREERGFLKHDESFATGADDWFAIGHDRPTVRLLQAGDEIEQRRFSTTTRADETNKFAFIHLQTHAIERLHETSRGQTFRDVVDRELLGATTSSS